MPVFATSSSRKTRDMGGRVFCAVPEQRGAGKGPNGQKKKYNKDALPAVDGKSHSTPWLKHVNMLERVVLYGTKDGAQPARFKFNLTTPLRNVRSIKLVGYTFYNVATTAAGFPVNPVYLIDFGALNGGEVTCQVNDQYTTAFPVILNTAPIASAVDTNHDAQYIIRPDGMARNVSQFTVQVSTAAPVEAPGQAVAGIPTTAAAAAFHTGQPPATPEFTHMVLNLAIDNDGDTPAGTSQTDTARTITHADEFRKIGRQIDSYDDPDQARADLRRARGRVQSSYRIGF